MDDTNTEKLLQLYLYQTIPAYEETGEKIPYPESSIDVYDSNIDLYDQTLVRKLAKVEQITKVNDGTDDGTINEALTNNVTQMLENYEYDQVVKTTIISPLDDHQLEDCEVTDKDCLDRNAVTILAHDYIVDSSILTCDNRLETLTNTFYQLQKTNDMLFIELQKRDIIIDQLNSNNDREFAKAKTINKQLLDNMDQYIAEIETHVVSDHAVLDVILRQMKVDTIRSVYSANDRKLLESLYEVQQRDKDIPDLLNKLTKVLSIHHFLEVEALKGDPNKLENLRKELLHSSNIYSTTYIPISKYILETSDYRYRYSVIKNDGRGNCFYDSLYQGISKLYTKTKPSHPDYITQSGTAWTQYPNTTSNVSGFKGFDGFKQITDIIADTGTRSSYRDRVVQHLRGYVANVITNHDDENLRNYLRILQSDDDYNREIYQLDKWLNKKNYNIGDRKRNLTYNEVVNHFLKKKPIDIINELLKDDLKKHIKEFLITNKHWATQQDILILSGYLDIGFIITNNEVTKYPYYCNLLSKDIYGQAELKYSITQSNMRISESQRIIDSVKTSAKDKLAHKAIIEKTKRQKKSWEAELLKAKSNLKENNYSYYMLLNYKNKIHYELGVLRYNLTPAGVPDKDIYETENSIYSKANLPKFLKTDININCPKNILNGAAPPAPGGGAAGGGTASLDGLTEGDDEGNDKDIHIYSLKETIRVRNAEITELQNGFLEKINELKNKNINSILTNRLISTIKENVINVIGDSQEPEIIGNIIENVIKDELSKVGNEPIFERNNIEEFEMNMDYKSDDYATKVAKKLKKTDEREVVKEEEIEAVKEEEREAAKKELSKIKSKDCTKLLKGKCRGRNDCMLTKGKKKKCVPCNLKKFNTKDKCMNK